jgi:autotransporter-associated beta strand protein
MLAKPSHAQNATWTGAVPGGDWNTNGNWVPASVPTGTATFDITGATQAVTVSADASIGTIALSAGAPTYSYTINPGVAFDILGAGIVNGSANAPNFLNNGNLNFSNASTAANANIINNSTLSFNNTSTAGSAVIINNGFVFFSDTSTAATSAITNNGAITFQNSSSAGSAVITNSGGGFLISFADTSTAGSATVTTNGGSLTQFTGNANGGSAQFITNAGGRVDFSGTTGPANNNQVTAGSIAGAGRFQLGANQLTVGSNNLSTTVSGSIEDGGNVPGTGASLVKVGAGILTLSGTSTYTGATAVNAGTLQGGAANAFAPTSAFTVAAGATLDLNNFDQTIGSLAGAGSVTLGTATLTAGANNTSTVYSGVISGNGGNLTKNGTGTLTLSGANTYTGTTTINAGTLLVTGSIATDVTVNAGGTLGGTGTIGDNVNLVGGTRAPGMPGSPGTLTICCNLTMSPTSTYQVQVTGGSASLANIAATAALDGTLAIKVNGFIDRKAYTILTAAGGLSGTQFAAVTVTGAPVRAVVTYEPNDVLLTLIAASLTPFLPPGLTGNQTNVANAINAFMNTGAALPSGLANLFALSPSQLAEALTQLSGENNAGGGQQASFQMMNEFLLLMLNPFDADRGGFGGGGFGAGSGARQFAAERALPPEIARAYAAVTPASERSMPFSSRWNVWASAYGGTNNTNGDPNGTGSHNFNARTGGVAAGLDYKLTPDTLIGVALAGGGTSWSLSQGLGGGQSDVFQAGLYGSQKFGPWYVSGAVAFANYWASTTRMVTLPGVDTLNAGFTAQSWGGRAEAGYRIA